MKRHRQPRDVYTVSGSSGITAPNSTLTCAVPSRYHRWKQRGKKLDASRARRVFVESPNSLGGKARMRRWAMLEEAIPEVRAMRLLDLGGTVESWRRSPVKPAHVTVLNLYEPGDSEDDSILPLVGDACDAAAVLASAGVAADFDVVFSNSLLEHVGGHARRVALANQVRQLAPHHWIQTPYRYFPVEPHWLFPAMQFMPAAVRVKIATHWPLVHTRPSNVQDARREVLWTELVSRTEMRDYFPDSIILDEKMLGITKSIIAVA